MIYIKNIYNNLYFKCLYLNELYISIKLIKY